MNSRKIIQLGNSSYVISVPKNWVKRNKLSKGDRLLVQENGKNDLIVRKQTGKDRQEKSGRWVVP